MVIDVFSRCYSCSSCCCAACWFGDGGGPNGVSVPVERPEPPAVVVSAVSPRSFDNP